MSAHWFEPLARHAGRAYLRYSFTKGTEQEVEFLVRALGLGPGQRVLDVGCGPGRHSRALATRGIEVVGIDISEPFVALARSEAPAGAAFARADARRLPVAAGSFDAAISLCQGGFGLVPGEDAGVIDEIARALRPGGRMAASAFSSYFVVRFLEEGDTFDPGAGVNHEVATVRSETGEAADFDLWTSCFTPRELRLIAAAAGLEVAAIWSVAPGAYAENPPDLEHPEWLLIARKRDDPLPGQGPARPGAAPN
jgi:SAM-dependent methyltransferase